MGGQEHFVDPFGAPEFFVDGVAYREMVGSDLVRITYFSSDHGEHIVRVKLLVPCAIIASEDIKMRWFLAQQQPTLRVM